MSRISIFTRALFAAVVCVLLVACGGGSSSTKNNPAPAITSFSPASAQAGTNAFTLTINGTGFGSASTVTWNGSSRAVTFISTDELQIPVSAADLTGAGTASVAVANAAPGGGQASAVFTISAPSAPTVAALSPNSALMGGSQFSLTVTGTNFVQSSTVQWNGLNLPTTYVSNSQLTAMVPGSDIVNPGNVPVTVVTPAPGGGTSATVQFVVTYPLPNVSAVTPSSLTAGGPLTGGPLKITINGTNFFPGATVYWNTTAARVTDFVSATQLTATLLPADIATGSVASISVQNPAPTAGMSNAVSITVNNPAPAITSVGPTTTQVAGTNIALTIDGSGFLPSSVVTLGTQSVAPGSVNATGTELTVNFASAPVGTLPVTVVNSAPAGGTSNSVDFDSIPAGTAVTQTLVSVDGSGSPVDSASGAMSENGRYVAFGAYVRDTCLGVAPGCTAATLQYSTNADQAVGVSDTGRYVTSQLHSSGTIGDLKFWDTCFEAASGCVPSIVAPPLSAGDAVPVGGTWLAPNARYLSYSTGPTDPTNPAPLSVYLFDTCVGAPPGCTPGPIATGQSTPGGYYSASEDELSATPDGRFLVYTDASSAIDLYDSCAGTAAGTCSSTNNVQFNVAPPGACEHPSISDTGRYIAFACRVQEMEVRLQDTCQGAMSCTAATATITSTSSGASSSEPIISGDGRFIAFVTAAPIIKGQTIGYPSVFLTTPALMRLRVALRPPLRRQSASRQMVLLRMPPVHWKA